MWTKEDIEQATDLQLHQELLRATNDIIVIWRKVPDGQFPTQKQENKISRLEDYCVLLAKELQKRGKLPKSWGTK